MQYKSRETQLERRIDIGTLGKRETETEDCDVTSYGSNEKR